MGAAQPRVCNWGTRAGRARRSWAADLAGEELDVAPGGPHVLGIADADDGQHRSTGTARASGGGGR